MSASNTKSRPGRPAKAEKFDRAASFPCYGRMLERVEIYRQENGLKSQGEVFRKLIEEGLKRAGIKE